MQNAATACVTLSLSGCGCLGPLGLPTPSRTALWAFRALHVCMHLQPPNGWRIMRLQTLREKRNARGPLGCYSPTPYQGLCG